MQNSPQSGQSAGAASDSRRARAILSRVERELGTPTTPTPEPASPPPIADHQLLRRIGSGAYGEVWLARSALGTFRAVKMVYRARFEDERPYEREFHGILKYEPISRTHEGLVQVLHVGRDDHAGCFYYVMELADAVIDDSAIPDASVETPEAASQMNSWIEVYSPRTLRSELRTKEQLAPAEAARLALRLAGALAHLHSHGLVHRDIKPNNIIFVAGQPKLADIGLVTGAGDSRSFVGTEGFVPPEGPGRPQGDIYGLGKLLYELATGRDRMDFPQLASDLVHTPDGEALLELNEIITRACTPDAKDRYRSAEEMRADLQLFLAGRSLRAARKTEQHLVWMKRFVGVGAACAVGAGIVAWLAKRSEHEAQQREKQSREHADVESALRARAESAEHASRQQLYAALLEQARATVRSGEIGHRVRTLDAIQRAAGISNSLDLQREAFAALALPDIRFEREWLGGVDVTAVHFDPGFHRMAVSRGPGPVEIRDVSDFKLITTLKPESTGASYRTTWSADGRYLAVKRDQDSGGERADLEIWEIAAEKLVTLVRGVPWGTMDFHPTLPRFAVGTTSGAVAVWDLETLTTTTLLIVDGIPETLRYSADGKRIAVNYPASGGWSISVHDSEHGDLLASCRFGNRITHIDWHPLGQWIAAPDYGGGVHLMDSETGAASALGRHKTTAVNVVFSPDGRFLVSGGWDRELICWDVRTRQRSFTLPKDSWKFLFRADGRQCAIVGEGWVQLYGFESPTGHRELGLQLGAHVFHAAFSPDGHWLAASGDRRLGLWDMTRETAGALANEAADARPFFTPDATELFGSSREDACFRWRIVPATGAGTAPRLERIPMTKPPGFTAVCVESNSVIWTSRQGSRVVPLQEISETDQWTETLRGVNRASADGQWLGIFRPFTPLLHVYRLPTLEPVAKLSAQANISAMSFAPSGREITVVARGATEFWNFETGRRTRLLTNCSAIVFTPDGNHAWMRRNRKCGLYHLDSTEPLLHLPGDTTPLALSPDGRRLAVSVEARRLQVWDLVELREELQALGLRALTTLE